MGFQVQCRVSDAVQEASGNTEAELKGKVGVGHSLSGRRTHFFQRQFKSLLFFVPQPLPLQNSELYYKCRARGSQEVGWFANSALGNGLAAADAEELSNLKRTPRPLSSLFHLDPTVIARRNRPLIFPEKGRVQGASGSRVGGEGTDAGAMTSCGRRVIPQPLASCADDVTPGARLPPRRGRPRSRRSVRASPPPPTCGRRGGRDSAASPGRGLGPVGEAVARPRGAQ